MPVEIKQSDSLSDDEYEHLFFWGEDIFGANSFNLTWRPKTAHLLLHEDGQLISHVGVLRHTVYVNDVPVEVGGVGGVVTLPAAQKKGYAARLMRHAAEFFACDWRVDAGLLFCLPRMVSYYERLDWQKIEDAVFVEQPGGAIESPLHVMVLPCGDYRWQKGNVELKSLPW